MNRRIYRAWVAELFASNFTSVSNAKIEWYMAESRRRYRSYVSRVIHPDY